MITTKSAQELKVMRQAGQIVADVHALMARMVQPGVSTAELDAAAEQLIRERGAIPTFKGYRGFPATLCISVNEQVIHGIPGKYRLKEGDVVSIDGGATFQGYVGDSAWSYRVGKVSEPVDALLRATEASLWQAIDKARVGNRLHDIGCAVQSYVEAQGYTVVREFCGHGVGTRLHEDPSVPNYGKAGTGPRLRSGWVLALEPMVNMGTADIRILSDKWTVVTRDNKPSAHFEHTVAITEDGPIILTALSDEIAYRFHARPGALAA